MSETETPETTAETAEGAEGAAPAEAAASGTPTPQAPGGPVRTVGRRKKATARICLTGSEGKVTVNGKPLEEYFLDVRDRECSLHPFEVLRCRDRFAVTVNVRGGGMVGQAGAVALGIARALVACDASVVPTLRAAGLLTRDARVKERKKYGRRGARRGFQFSKR